MTTELGTPRDKQWLQECCDLVEAKMPENYAFVVFAFPTRGGSARLFYASNGDRADIIAALKEWIAHAESEPADHGKHVS